MKPTIFGYSKLVGWSGLLLHVGALALLLYMIVRLVMLTYDIKIVLCFVLLVLLTIGLLIYFLIWCFMPMINNAAALELDEEKLQCYVTGETIYWSDVVEISIKYKTRDPFITFEMVDGSDNLDVPIKWIEGDTTSIYNKVQAYFARTL